MTETKKKSLVVDKDIHAKIAEAARQRGMTIYGLHERILRGWISDNFFGNNVASSNAQSK